MRAMKGGTVWFLLTILAVGGLSAGQGQLVEEIKIKWWVVPIFAIDAQDRPVRDLKKQDIELTVNREKVDDFYLVRKDLVKTSPSKMEDRPTEFIPRQKKMIFLLVDLVYTGGVSLKKYREVIHDLVNQAEENVDFFLFSISGFKGLVYHAGPTSQKADLLRIVDRLTPENTIRRDDYIRRETARMREDMDATMNEYKDVDIFGLVESERMLKSALKSRTYRKNNNYFQSFQYLYYIINSLQPAKFIYLFSRGIPRYAMEDMGPGSVINRLSNRVENIVRDLNSAGAILTLINPMGQDEQIKRIDPHEEMTSMEVATRNIDEVDTGEFFVRQLARQSGGKYFEGTVEDINRQLRNYHLAYYELAFSDIQQPSQKRRQLKIDSFRSGVRLYTFRSVKEGITYSDMNPVEKKLHAVNVLLGNIPTTRMIFDVRPVQILSQEKELNRETYYLGIPETFIGEKLDIYTLRMGAQYEIPRINTRSITVDSDRYTLTIDKEPPEMVLFIVINGETLSALAYGMNEKAAYYHLITVAEPQYRDQTLSFDLKNYQRSPQGEGLVMVQVGMYDQDEKEIYQETKVIVPREAKVHITIPFRKVFHSEIQYVLIKAKDLMTERSTVKMLTVSPG